MTCSKSISFGLSFGLVYLNAQRPVSWPTYTLVKIVGTLRLYLQLVRSAVETFKLAGAELPLKFLSKALA